MPIRNSELHCLVTLHVCSGCILPICVRGRHKCSEPVHWMAVLVKTISCKEVRVWATKDPWLNWHRLPQLPRRGLLPPPFLPVITSQRGCTTRFHIPHLLISAHEDPTLEPLHHCILWVPQTIHFGGGVVALIFTQRLGNRLSSWRQQLPPCRDVQSCHAFVAARLVPQSNWHIVDDYLFEPLL